MSHRDIKGTFHARMGMGTVRNRNGKDITEAEEIKNRFQEFTEEIWKISMRLTRHEIQSEWIKNCLVLHGCLYPQKRVWMNVIFSKNSYLSQSC